MSGPILTKRRILLGVLGLIGFAFWYALIDRATAELDRDGWHVRFSYVRLSCHHCTGRVEELSWQGHCIPLPQAEGQNLVMRCTLGSFRIIREPPEWHLEGGLPGWPRLEASDSATSVTEEDLARGSYDYTDIPEAEESKTDSDRTWRKAGTPTGWALVLGTQHKRWVQPTRIHELKW